MFLYPLLKTDPVNRTFLLGTIRTLSFGADNTNSAFENRQAKSYTRRRQVMTASGDELTSTGHAITQLLIQWGKGDRAAFDELLPLVYRELHKMAKRYMAQQKASHTLQTTAVIHEAY